MQLGARGTSILFASGDGGVSGSLFQTCDDDGVEDEVNDNDDERHEQARGIKLKSRDERDGDSAP